MGDSNGCGSGVDRADCACASPDDANATWMHLFTIFVVMFLLSITWPNHQSDGCRVLIPIHLTVAVIRKLRHDCFALLGCYAPYIGSFLWTAWST